MPSSRRVNTLCLGVCSREKGSRPSDPDSFSVSENRICRKFISLHKNSRCRGAHLSPYPPEAPPRPQFAFLARVIATTLTYACCRLYRRPNTHARCCIHRLGGFPRKLWRKSLAYAPISAKGLSPYVTEHPKARLLGLSPCLCPTALGNPPDKDRHKEAESASSIREADTREKGTRGNRATGGNREKSTRGKGRTGSRNRHWHYPNANSRCWLDRAFSEVSGADSAPNAVGSGGSTYGKLRTNALLSSMLVAERISGP